MSKTCPVCQRVYDDEHIFCAADGTTLLGDVDRDDLIGKVVDDRYVITKMLGEGGMGRVYQGHHVHLPRQVAIKVLHAHLSNDPGAVARFNREAASASRIENSHVARVFDFGRMAGGATYLAMEFIPGRTLSDILRDDGALAPARVVMLIDQIANGLGAAHRLGIVHRDLKPDNVIVSDIEGQERAKIVDFGIAKAIGVDESSTLTSSGFITGTPGYMSPEQLMGQTLDQRSDVFALGLLTFRLLTDELPFPPPTPERGFSAILTDAPRTLADVVPSRVWSGHVQAVFDQVLSRAPGDRYPTAEAFADALTIAFHTPDDVPVVVTPQSRSRALNPPFRAIPQRDGELAANSRDAGIDDPTVPVVRVQSVAVDQSYHAAGNTLGAHTGQSERDPSTTSRRVPAISVGVLVVAAAAVIVIRMNRDSTTLDQQQSPNAVSTAPLAVQSNGGSGNVSTRSSTSPSSASPSSSAPAPIPASPNAPPASSLASSSSPRTPATRPQSSAAPAPSANSTATAPPRITSNVESRLDGIRDSLDALLMAEESADGSARAQRFIVRVDALLPNARSSGDSARAYLLKANLQKFAGDRSAACRTLLQARPLATSTADRNSVTRNSGLWSC